MFLLDLAVVDDDNDAAPNDPDTMAPQLLLHAINGIHTSNTMQVHLRLGDVNVHALIDSTTSSPRRWPAAPDSPCSIAALRMSRWPMASTCHAQACIGGRRSPSTPRSSPPTFSRYRWPSTTSSSAPGGWLPLDRFSGTLRPSPCPFGTRIIRSAGSLRSPPEPLQLHQPPGRTSTASSTALQPSSSRTSCSSREG